MLSPDLDASGFMAEFNVSRETVEKLKIYGEKIQLWQKAVNLVAPRTLSQIWQRHFADSAQLVDLIPEQTRSLVDLGAGGGFPGLVLAILLREARPEIKITLIESDQRKAAFLREVARAVDNPVRILSTRIETNASKDEIGVVDLISARALAPLDRLLALAEPFWHASTVGLFPKGHAVDAELEAVEGCWDFQFELVPSRTSEAGRIVVIRQLQRSPEGESRDRTT